MNKFELIIMYGLNGSMGLEIKFRLYPRFWFLTTLNNIPFVNTNLRLKKCVRLWMVVKAELSRTPG